MEKRKRKTKKQKHEEHVKFMDELRKLPEDQLSPVAKYWLEHEHDEPVKLNMRVRIGQSIGRNVYGMKSITDIPPSTTP